MGSPFTITVPLASLHSANGVNPDPASFITRNLQKEFPSYKLSSLSLTCHGWNGWSGAKHWFLPCFATTPLYDRGWLMSSFSHKGPTFCLQSLKTDELAPKPAPPHRTATGRWLSQFVCCPGRDIALTQCSSQQCVFNHMRLLSVFPLWTVSGKKHISFLTTTVHHFKYNALLSISVRLWSQFHFPPFIALSYFCGGNIPFT